MIWRQHWTDVLFLHYEVAAGDLAPHLSNELEIDTHQGDGWLSLVFFRLTLRPAGAPYLPGFSSLLELNVRTYVRYRGQPGIAFLRMYADNWLAIGAARLLTPLCYEPAAMQSVRLPGGARRIACQPHSGSQLAVEFDIAGVPRQPDAQSLDAWLMERYRLFVK